jgi:hypothetical protein
VATVIGAVITPEGTVVWIFVAEELTTDAATAPKVTLVTPVKFVPEIVTAVPVTPADGTKPVICGAFGFEVAKVPTIPPALIRHVPAAATVAPFADVEEVLRYLMNKVVPAGTLTARPVALTVVSDVLVRFDIACCVHGPDKLVAVSTATARGPVLLLRKVELIAEIVRSYPTTAVTE